MARKKSKKNIAARVCIDAGHGGMDTGAYYDGLAEKDITLRAAGLLQEELQEAGIETVLTRSDDISVPDGFRVNAANSRHAHLLISFHCFASPSPGPAGVQVIFPPDGNLRLAEILFRAMARDGEIREGQEYILRYTGMPSFIIGLGFLSNPADRQRLRSSGYLPKLIRNLAGGIKEILQMGAEI